MKQILILVMLFLTIHLYGQSDTPHLQKKPFTYGVQIGYTDGKYFTALSPNFVFSYKKNSVLIGPNLFLLNGGGENFFKGFQLTYKRYPNANTNAKRYDFYFLYSMSYIISKHTESREYIDYKTGNNHPSSYKHDIKNFDILFGYGFDFKIKNFYIDQSLGLGISFIGENYSLDVPSLPSASYNEPGKLSDRFDFARMFKIGIGYKF